MSDLSLFLGQMIRKPLQVSAVAPSSSVLAREMAKGLGPETGPVAEFGPGTGKITKAILDRGVAPENLTLFEMNPTFCARLKREYPDLRVENLPAQDLPLAGLPPLGAVISGLPLLSMSEATQRAIVGAAIKALRPGGIFVQFTYGPRPPMLERVRQELGLQVTRGHRVFFNLPPATVHTYRQH